MLKVLLSMVLFAGAMPAYATVYHVSPRGNNYHSGKSPSLAWRTIQYAAYQSVPGDQILIHDGDYRAENVNLRACGSESAPIRIEAAPGERPVVGGFRVTGAHWIEIRGLTFKGPKIFPANWKDMPEVVIDDPHVGIIDPQEPQGSRREKVEQKFGTYVKLKREVERGYLAGIGVREQSSHITIQGNTISHFTLGVHLSGESSFIRIEDNDIHHCREGIWTFDRTASFATSDVLVRNNRCTQNLTWGIEFRDSAQRIIIEDNICENNAMGHISFRVSSNDGVIRRNRLQNGGFYAETMEYPGSSALNLHMLKPNANLLVERNYEAYQEEPTWDSNGLILDLSPHSAVIVRYNTFYRNMGAGITLTKSPGAYIYHNTAVENGFQAPGVVAPTNGPGLRLTRVQDTDLRIINNIFSRNRIAGVDTGGLLVQQTRVDHNLYDPAAGTVALRDGPERHKSYPTVTQVRARTSAESQGVTADPAFVDASAADFRLTSVSPAIDAGGYLTQTRNAGQGQQIPVEDAGYFFPGFSGLPGDQVLVGTDTVVRVTAVDRERNILTVDTSVTWSNGTPVTLPYVGKAPDIGAYELSDDNQSVAEF